MKKIWKKRAVVASVLLLVAAAVYLNWRYTDQVAKSSKVLGESTLVSSETKVDQTAQNQEEGQDTAAAEEMSAGESDYFATARLSRKQARDSAIGMLQEAEVDEHADEQTLNAASQTLQVLASYTVAESQIESLVTAKGYQDCVAFMGAESISVVVCDPDGLDTADVARIKDIVISETNYTPDQIKIVEAN